MAFPIVGPAVKIPSNIPMPQINTDAARLADVDARKAAADKGGVDPNLPVEAVKTGLAYSAALEKMSEDERKAKQYKDFQSALDAGWPAYQVFWEKAGSPPEYEPGKMKAIAANLAPDKAQEVLVSAYQGLTGLADKGEIRAGRTAAQSAAEAGGDEAGVAGKLSPLDPKFDIVGATKTKQAREDKTKALADKMDYWKTRDENRNKTIIKAAGIRAAGVGDYNAIVNDVTAEIENAQADIDDRKGQLDALDATISAQDGARATKSQTLMRKQLEDGIDKARNDKIKLEQIKATAQGKGGRASRTPDAPKTPPKLVYNPATGKLEPKK